MTEPEAYAPSTQEHDVVWTRAEFTGQTGRLARVVTLGTTLQLLTLAVYRFWYLTNLRRFFWSSTRLGGDALEYTGRGMELFVGFLIAMVVIVPTVIALTFLTVSLGPLGWLLSIAAALLFVLLRHYARFRARRYQLTRTVWRGLRFHLAGSAWVYAFRACGLYGLMFLSLGLAYPFAIARLERYKIANTWYGDLKGEFEGSGREIFGATLAFWFACLATAVFGLPLRIIMSANDTTEMVIYTMVPLQFVILIFFLLLPLYRAIVFRWWVNSIRFGDIYLRSDLSNGAFYRPYILYGLACALLLPIFGGLGAAGETVAEKGHSGAALALAAGYIIIASIMAGLYQLIVVRLVWSRQVSSTQACGLERLDSVRARGDESSAFGEGVLDALDAVGS